MGRRRAARRRRLLGRGPDRRLYESGDLVYESFAIDEVEARFYGEAAVATGRQSQAGTYQGQAVDVMQGEFRATLVFVEREGRWLLAGLHLSPIAGMPRGR